MIYFLILTILFITVPLAEITLLILLSKEIGISYTIVIIVFTGIIGAYLAKKNGKHAWKEFRTEMSKGALPAKQLLDCALIFIAGLLLVTPGIITDITGFLLLTPFTRNFIYKQISSRIQFGSNIHHDFSHATSHNKNNHINDDSVIDIKAEEVNNNK